MDIEREKEIEEETENVKRRWWEKLSAIYGDRERNWERFEGDRVGNREF